MLGIKIISYYWSLSSVSFYELPFYTHSSSSGELSSCGPLNVDISCDSVLWSLRTFSRLSWLSSSLQVMIHISMPSFSLVIQLAPWHFHWITHAHLILHIPRAPNTSLSHLVAPWQVAPLSVLFQEAISVLGPKLSALLMPFSCSQLALSFRTFKMCLLWLLSLHSHYDHRCPNAHHFMSDYIPTAF